MILGRSLIYYLFIKNPEPMTPLGGDYVLFLANQPGIITENSSIRRIALLMWAPLE